MPRRVPVDQLQPSKKIVAKAIQQENGEWIGLWSIPGMIPDYVKFKDTGALRTYVTEAAATAAAMHTAISVFNAPRERVFDTKGSVRARGGRPAKMNGRELSAAMGRHGLSPGDLAFILDKPVNRILGWMDGSGKSSDIPHEVRVIMAIFDRHDDAIDIAESVTNDAIDEREDAG